jgi:GH15 family glucan-1,4-alpha-glucosidase
MKITGRNPAAQEEGRNHLRYEPLREYGIIGDCHTAALVSRDGSIDWYCPTRFDAPAVFCRLLDAKIGGYSMVAPAGEFHAERHYVHNTNILETVFTTSQAKVRITDFMPVHQRTAARRGYDVGTSRRILRLVEALAGDAKMEIHFHPTLDYARGETVVTVKKGLSAVAHKNGMFLSLVCPGFELDFQANGKGRLCSSFELRQGNRRWLVLADADDADSISELPTVAHCEQQLLKARHYWENWASQCTYGGPYRNEVLRSALTLKLLTYEPTGAIVAAPTSSLPEEIGGERNWDYRYSWVRDSALMLYALMNIGYREEAADFFEWLQETHHNDPSPDLQVLYGIDGRRELPETTLDHLEGYECSRPVRVGNAAAKQLQLDIYGEVLTAAYLYFTSKIGRRRDKSQLTERERLLEHDWGLLRGLVERAAQRWQEPDDGIWEVRDRRLPYLYSRLMCWAALDRGIRLAKEHSLDAPLDGWDRIREAIRRAVLTEGFDRKAGAFTQAFGASALDASALLIARTGLLPATDPRVQSTIQSIKSALARDGLVFRYRSKDGLPGSEGTFTACSFWLVDALALSGKLDEAHELFERVSGYANDLGLFSEETDSKSDKMLGNFPQGFTHMALINAAINLAKATKHGAEEQAETEAERAARAGAAASEGYLPSHRNRRANILHGKDK